VPNEVAAEKRQFEECHEVRGTRVEAPPPADERRDDRKRRRVESSGGPEKAAPGAGTSSTAGRPVSASWRHAPAFHEQVKFL
jgi:hypothetical protein